MKVRFREEHKKACNFSIRPGQLCQTKELYWLFVLIFIFMFYIFYHIFLNTYVFVLFSIWVGFRSDKFHIPLQRHFWEGSWFIFRRIARKVKKILICKTMWSSQKTMHYGLKTGLSCYSNHTLKIERKSIHWQNWPQKSRVKE